VVGDRQMRVPEASAGMAASQSRQNPDRRASRGFDQRIGASSIRLKRIERRRRCWRPAFAVRPGAAVDRMPSDPPIGAIVVCRQQSAAGGSACRPSTYRETEKPRVAGSPINRSFVAGKPQFRLD
jgi:hypothetical protein